MQNTALKIELAGHEKNEKESEARLAEQNKETSDFAHALATQQARMAGQARLSPLLDQNQVEALAAFLKPFAGNSVDIHSTADTTVLRLERTIKAAFQIAGIKTPGTSVDIGALCQGVSVVVHSPTDVPHFADALADGLHNAGIEVHTASLSSQVPQGHVALSGAKLRACVSANSFPLRGRICGEKRGTGAPLLSA
jgi:hypothetical protein